MEKLPQRLQPAAAETGDNQKLYGDLIGHFGKAPENEFHAYGRLIERQDIGNDLRRHYYDATAQGLR